MVSLAEKKKLLSWVLQRKILNNKFIKERFSIRSLSMGQFAFQLDNALQNLFKNS